MRSARRRAVRGLRARLAGAAMVHAAVTGAVLLATTVNLLGLPQGAVQPARRAVTKSPAAPMRATSNARDTTSAAPQDRPAPSMPTTMLNAMVSALGTVMPIRPRPPLAHLRTLSRHRCPPPSQLLLLSRAPLSASVVSQLRPRSIPLPPRPPTLLRRREA